MRAAIIGAGEVGRHIARVLVSEDIEVVVVDTDSAKLNRITHEVDVATVLGEASSQKVLDEIGSVETDFLIAATNSDEQNMIACLMAKSTPKIKRRIARIRNLDYFNNKALLGPSNLDINPAISPELEAAWAIVRLMKVPMATNVEEFEDGAVKIIGLKIPDDSHVVGKRLMDVNLGIRFLVGVIIRGETAYIPNGASVIRARDIIYLPVKSNNVTQVINAIGGKARPVRRIMIIGGGRIGFNVARELDRKSDITVKIIEPDKNRCNFLANHLKRAIVFQGSASDIELLAEENIGDMDVFAATTNNEEVNIIASLLAKKMGAKKIITLVNRSNYIPLANDLGIEAVLSPRLITASTILRYIRKGDIISLTTTADGKAEIIEAEIQNNIRLNGPLVNIKFPDKVLVGAIIRDKQVIIPSGKDWIQNQDRVIIFAFKESVKEIEALL